MGFSNRDRDRRQSGYSSDGSDWSLQTKPSMRQKKNRLQAEVRGPPPPGRPDGEFVRPPMYYDEGSRGPLVEWPSRPLFAPALGPPPGWLPPPMYYPAPGPPPPGYEAFAATENGEQRHPAEQGHQRPHGQSQQSQMGHRSGYQGQQPPRDQDQQHPGGRSQRPARHTYRESQGGDSRRPREDEECRPS